MNRGILVYPIASRFAITLMITLLAAAAAGAQTSLTGFTFVVGSGFVCDLGDSGSCPAVVKSPDGDSYEMAGAGTFDAHNKSVKAAGTFRHKSPSGVVLETGVWVANELIQFDSYGIAPAALLHREPSAPSQRGTKHSPMSSSSMPIGGLARFHILLEPMSGPAKMALLQANSALGHVPSERPTEGIRLTIENGGRDFSEEVSGRVMFLAIRPDIPTAPQKETAPPPPEND